MAGAHFPSTLTLVLLVAKRIRPEAASVPMGKDMIGVSERSVAMRGSKRALLGAA
jgi:hypothetical protein